nr:hypothetical protein [Tanacetum cinerariifolium]
MVNGTNHSKVNHSANTVPKAMLTRTGLKPVNSVRPVNPKRPNSTVLNAVKANKSKAVKASMCDKKNSVLKCFVLSPDFKLADESHVLLKVPRKNNMYSVDMKNIVPKKDLTCLVAKATNNESMLWHMRLADESHVLLKVPRKNNMYSVDMKNIVPKKDLTCLVAKATNNESMLWHRRLGHINFKKIISLLRKTLLEVCLPNAFENDKTCVACLKGKQQKVSFKSIIQNYTTQPLFMLHMDLFGPTFVSSLMDKKYRLVITDDFSRFTWVFFLATKDETSRILKSFITEIENLVGKKVKIIKCDNGTKIKNSVMNECCEEKGIKREYSVARTPQQTRIAERRNKTLIEAARTMILVVTPHFKTPYELFRGRTHALSFMRPFGCHVTILNTLDHLGKFDGKSNDGFFVGYSTNSKAFRVYNTRTKKVEENLHINVLENKPIIAGTNSNDFARKGASFDAGQSSMETGPSQDYILMPL